MNWPESVRWQRLCQSIHASGDALAWYERLRSAHASPGRRYHNQRHIGECLAEFDAARSLAKQPEAVELALWFHDAIYDSTAADNEERSAELAKECLVSAGRADLAQTVAALVMATKLHNATVGSDAALVVDVDLSILGQDERRFADYEAGIRAEYAWVAEKVFKAKRAEILQGFLKRQRIYSTEHFWKKYEVQARRNLEKAIRGLK
jgi:predicted metal-dependent HD superfamily phosphohydrolase